MYWLLEAKLWKRIAKDPYLANKIMGRLVGYDSKATGELIHAEGIRHAAQKAKGFMHSGGSTSRAGIEFINKAHGAHGIDKAIKQDMRGILKYKHDKLADTSMSHPLKRASYFKTNKGVHGRAIISPSKIPDIDYSHNLLKGPAPRINPLEYVKERTAQARHNAEVVLRDTRKKAKGSPNFKLFGTRIVKFNHATDVPKQDIIKGLKSNEVRSPANLGHSGPLGSHGDMPVTAGLWASPGRPRNVFKVTTGIEHIKGTIPANAAVYGPDTITYRRKVMNPGGGGKKSVIYPDPEMFIPKSNFKSMKLSKTQKHK